VNSLLRGLAAVLANYDGSVELERGLDILLTSLRTQLPDAPFGTVERVPGVDT
jgi:hypothetical protein